MAKNTIYCNACDTEHPASSFYKSNSKFYEFRGVLPFCKQYIVDFCKKQDEDGVYDESKVMELFRIMDFPFLHDVWEQCLSDIQKDTLRSYISTVNLRYKGCTWENSVFKEDIVTKIESERDTAINLMDLGELRTRWGAGYEKDELMAFERKYGELKGAYSERTAMHTEALFKYIRYSVKEEIAVSRNQVKEARDWGALAESAAKAAKIQPNQLSQADLQGGLSTFSELAKAVEKEVDILEILPEFIERPKDKVDMTILCYANYVRDLKGLPPAKHSDIYAFIERNKDERDMAEGGSDE